jgi:hypothetical protein
MLRQHGWQSGMHVRNRNFVSSTREHQWLGAENDVPIEMS